jgi:hypothetical protein
VIKLPSFVAREVSSIVMFSRDAKLSSWVVTELIAIVVAMAAVKLTAVVVVAVELTTVVVAVIQVAVVVVTVTHVTAVVAAMTQVTTVAVASPNWKIQSLPRQI